MSTQLAATALNLGCAGNGLMLIEVQCFYLALLPAPLDCFLSIDELARLGPVIGGTWHRSEAPQTTAGNARALIGRARISILPALKIWIPRPERAGHADDIAPKDRPEVA